MRVMLDTHIVVWNALSPERLSEQAREVLALSDQPENMIISDISLWEISMMISKGRLHVDGGCQGFLNLLVQAYRLALIPVSPEIAALATQLPPDIREDPADRLIVATALAEKVPLVTADPNLRAARVVHTVW